MSPLWTRRNTSHLSAQPLCLCPTRLSIWMLSSLRSLTWCVPLLGQPCPWETILFLPKRPVSTGRLPSRQCLPGQQNQFNYYASHVCHFKLSSNLIFKKKVRLILEMCFIRSNISKNIIISTSSIQRLPARYLTCFFSNPTLRFPGLSEIQSFQSIHVVFKRNYIASVFKVKFKLIKMK